MTGDGAGSADPWPGAGERLHLQGRSNASIRLLAGKLGRSLGWNRPDDDLGLTARLE
jgi:hypothetical protein